jgi:hypothetical protein
MVPEGPKTCGSGGSGTLESRTHKRKRWRELLPEEGGHDGPEELAAGIVPRRHLSRVELPLNIINRTVTHLFSNNSDPGCSSQIQCCGSGMFIPDPNIFHPGSVLKNLSILNQKLFLSSRKYDPGCSSRIRIPDPDPGY